MAHEQIDLPELGFTVDVGLEELIRACWMRGIATKSSCIGHQRNPDYHPDGCVWLNLGGADSAAQRWEDLTGIPVDVRLGGVAGIVTEVYFPTDMIPEIIKMLLEVPRAKTARELAVRDAWNDVLYEDGPRDLVLFAEKIGMGYADVLDALWPRDTHTELEQRVWAAWEELSDEDGTPVKTIATMLGMSNADVAFIVFPAERFGAWSDDQEPDV